MILWHYFTLEDGTEASEEHAVSIITNNLEDGGNIFLRNVGIRLQEITRKSQCQFKVFVINTFRNFPFKCDMKGLEKWAKMKVQKQTVRDITNSEAIIRTES
jgi:hypothetical protein